MTKVNLDSGPQALAVKQTTDNVYVTAANSVPVIDHADDIVPWLRAGNGPTAQAVNSLVDRISVAHATTNNVTVFNGYPKATTTVPARENPGAIAVNEQTDTIYVANLDSNNLTLINGATDTTTTVPAGLHPQRSLSTKRQTQFWAPQRHNQCQTIPVTMVPLGSKGSPNRSVRTPDQRSTVDSCSHSPLPVRSMD